MNPVDRVRAALIEKGLGDVVLELDDTAATAPLAAAAIGAHYGIVVSVGAIVKSLVFLIDGQPAIVLGSGDRNVDRLHDHRHDRRRPRALRGRRPPAVVGG